jgi:hypothetical protein
MSAGQFTCSQLVDVQVKAEQIWADNASKKDYIANVETIKAVISEQTAQLKPELATEKDNQVKIAWIKDCDDSSAPCTDECSVGGNEVEVACDTHTLTLCRKVGFTVKEKALRNNMFNPEEFIAKAMMRKKKTLDEWLTTQVVTYINANVGVNQYTGSKGTVSGFNTYIPASYWNAGLFSYFALVSKKNKFSDSFLLSGDNLYEAEWNAAYNKSNPDGQSDAAKFGSMRKYFDVFNIDTLLDPDKKTFLIDRGALAFVSKTYYTPQPRDYGANVGIKYSVPSENIEGVSYDVTYKIRCLSDEIYHDYSLQTKAGIFINPKGCNLNNTGIISFTCGTGS